MKNEYNENIKIAERFNKTLNYTDIKENESAKEAVNNLLNFKQIPKNCTQEETKGIGNRFYQHFINNSWTIVYQVLVQSNVYGSI